MMATLVSLFGLIVLCLLGIRFGRGVLRRCLGFLLMEGLLPAFLLLLAALFPFACLGVVTSLALLILLVVLGFYLKALLAKLRQKGGAKS
ncbi:hypothetical protein ACUHMQ_16460 [Chitinimonas sp. PSY-7]|uniref:hypothetical protein n=1 Tax=Chitinimonas sp. PSY-7 TaxID=3459088 RepID=UPI0040402FFF